MSRRRGIVAIVVAAAAAAGCGGSERGEESAPSGAPAQASGPVSLPLEQVNGTGQTGVAALTETDAGVRVTVEVNVDDVHQLAAIAKGTCDSPGLHIYSLIDSDLVLDPPTGKFETQAATRFEDETPVGFAELETGEFAVVVADIEARPGGLLSELPPDTRLLEGPSGWEATPLAACGNIPSS